MKLANFRLIVEVQQRRELWDSTMLLSQRKEHFNEQWQQVADILQMDEASCKKRFKGLRDSYRAEVRKIQRRGLSTSNWPYFRALEFMRKIFDPDKLVPFPPGSFDIDVDCGGKEPNQLDDCIIDVDRINDDSFDFEIMGDIFKCESSQGQDSGSDMSMVNRQTYEQPTSNISMPMNSSDVGISPRLQSPLLLPQAAKRARRRKTSSSTDGAGADQNSHPTFETTVKDDPDYNFLVSLLPHVKSLSSMNNMKFRMEVSRMLMDLNQEDLQRTAQRKSDMPYLISAPKPNYCDDESAPPQNSCGVAHSSLIECDVKIENENPL